MGNKPEEADQNHLYDIRRLEKIRGGVWQFVKVDGTNASNGWFWIDGNHDGTAECYYFDVNGNLMTNTMTPDHYYVNKDGAWTVNGIVQKMATDGSGAVVAGSTGNASGSRSDSDNSNNDSDNDNTDNKPGDDDSKPEVPDEPDEPDKPDQPEDPNPPEEGEIQAEVDGTMVHITAELESMAGKTAALVIYGPEYTGGVNGWYTSLNNAVYVNEIEVSADGKVDESIVLESVKSGQYTVLIGREEISYGHFSK